MYYKDNTPFIYGYVLVYIYIHIATLSSYFFIMDHIAQSYFRINHIMHAYTCIYVYMYVYVNIYMDEYCICSLYAAASSHQTIYCIIIYIETCNRDRSTFYIAPCLTMYCI